MCVKNTGHVLCNHRIYSEYYLRTNELNPNIWWNIDLIFTK